MKTLKEKISETPLKCDEKECIHGRVLRPLDDVILIHYRRGEVMDVLTPGNFMNDRVELYHVDCLPERLRGIID